MTEIEIVAHNNALLQYTFAWILIGLIITIIFLIKEKWEKRQQEKYDRMNCAEANRMAGG